MSEDADIIARAKDRFRACQERESTFRQRFVDDIKFLFADSDNQEQWNAAVRAQRQLDARPMLTINKTHTHWLHVVNDGKSNKPSIHVHPTGDQATYEAAQVFEGIIRHIEYASDAQSAYDVASEFQVGGGIGYWRLVTEYTDDNGFDQEIFIRPIPDPLSVYLDPGIKLTDGSDARFGFIYDEWPLEEFKRKYPDAAQASNAIGGDGWLGKDTVRVAEYYEVEVTKEWMFAIPSEQDPSIVEFVRESQLTKDQIKLFELAAKKGSDLNIQKRRVEKREVKWYLIAGNEVVDRSIWAGKYVPIIRVVGEEVTLQGKLDRKGLVRYMKDAQRMYNYNTSAQVEFGALQTKTPWVGPVQAFEGLENYWAGANRENTAFLPYNGLTENGDQIAPPQRAQPPAAAEAFSAGMQAAAVEMMMASGQYEATFGKQTQELSGVALDNRKAQGERATFHFLDGMSKAIRFTGKQLVDLIPKIYDTKRVIRILGEDGEEQQITVDPELRGPLQEVDDAREGVISTIFNPKVGKYDVVAKAGPGYDTMREEAFNAMKELIIGVPDLVRVFGDIFVSTSDFPNKDKVAERLRAWIPADVRGDGPTPQEQQLMQQVEQLTGMIQQLAGELQSKQNAERLAKQEIDARTLDHLAERMESDRRATIDAFRAETDRMGKLLETMSPEAIAPIVAKLVGEIIQSPDLIVGNQPGEMNGSDMMAIGLQTTELGIPLHEPAAPTAPQQ